MKQIKALILVLLLITMIPVALAQEEFKEPKNPNAVSAEEKLPVIAKVRNNKPEYRPGYDLGYYVWQNGKNWHICWSGDSRKYTTAAVTEVTENTTDVYGEGWHGFNGKITSNGNFYAVVARAYEFSQDKYAANQDEITFDARAGPHQDCLVFRTTGDKVIFEIYIDEEKKPELVYIGGNKVNPTEIPFTWSALPSEAIKVKPSVKAIKKPWTKRIADKLLGRKAVATKTPEDEQDQERETSDSIDETIDLIEEDLAANSTE